MNIPTKYNLGDSVYFIVNNTICYDQISAMEVKVDKSGIKISYTMTNVQRESSGMFSYYTSIAILDEDKCKLTKEEL